MATFGDRLRRLLAGVLGILAGALFVYGALRLIPGVPAGAAGALRLSPHGREWVIVGAAVGIPMVVSWLYGAWIDALLSGPAVVRGTKFGAILAAWLVAGAFLIRQAGMTEMPAPSTWRGLALVAGACLSYGTVVGLVYGAGRQYDVYRAGLAYGLADRPLLSEPPGRPSLA